MYIYIYTYTIIYVSSHSPIRQKPSNFIWQLLIIHPDRLVYIHASYIYPYPQP